MDHLIHNQVVAYVGGCKPNSRAQYLKGTGGIRQPKNNLHPLLALCSWRGSSCCMITWGSVTRCGVLSPKHFHSILFFIFVSLCQGTRAILLFLVNNFLTSKILSIFLPISAVSDLVGGVHFSTKKSMRT
jgi:hypothetical protein